MKKPKWAKGLTVKELRHVADAGNSGRASLRVALANKDNPHCLECRLIGAKVRVN
jgi:hypothetical protein